MKEINFAMPNYEILEAELQAGGDVRLVNLDLNFEQSRLEACALRNKRRLTLNNDLTEATLTEIEWSEPRT